MKWLLPISSLLGLLVLVLWMAGEFDDKVAPGYQMNVVDLNQAGILLVEDASVPLLAPTPATIVAKENAAVSARILARIDQIKVRAGDIVKKGQVLVILEHSDLMSRVAQMKAQIAAIEAKEKESEQALKRAEELTRRGLLAQAALESAEASYKSLEAQKLSAQQSLTEAQAALDFAKILAPFDGLVVDRLAEPGSMAQPGKAILSLYNPNSIQIEAQVPESNVVHLALGQVLELEVDVTKTRLTTEIEEIVPAVNRASRTFQVKGSLLNAQGLLPGMYARMFVPVGETKEIRIPSSYVTHVGQLATVKVVHFNGEEATTIENRIVKLALSQKGDEVVVLSGLVAGEKLIP